MCYALCDCAFRIGVAPARRCVNAASILRPFLKIQSSLQKRCEDASNSNSESVRESSTACKMGRAGSPLHAAALISNGAHRSDAPYRAIYCSRECGPSSGRFLHTRI